MHAAHHGPDRPRSMWILTRLQQGRCDEGSSAGPGNKQHNLKQTNPRRGRASWPRPAPHHQFGFAMRRACQTSVLPAFLFTFRCLGQLLPCARPRCGLLVVSAPQTVARHHRHHNTPPQGQKDREKSPKGVQKKVLTIRGRELSPTWGSNPQP